MDDEGWWYRVRSVIWIRRCRKCEVRKEQKDFAPQEWSKKQPAICVRCDRGKGVTRVSSGKTRSGCKRVKKSPNPPARRPRAAHENGSAIREATSGASFHIIECSTTLTYPWPDSCLGIFSSRKRSLPTDERSQLRSASELRTFIRAQVDQQDRLEAMGYRSPTWRLLRALQSLLSAVQLQEESAVTSPPFFPRAGRGTIRFWGKEQGPTVFLWESLGEEGREECEQAIRTRKDWVVWSRARPAKGDCEIRGFEQEGKAFFCGKRAHTIL